MSEMVTGACSRCGRLDDRLEKAPLPGKYGEAVLAQTCKSCWEEWMRASINLINHYGLIPANPKHREQLYQLMKEFLKLQM